MLSESGIWSTIEVYCISADMSYENDYLKFMKDFRHAPLCEEAYNKLKEVFDIQLKNDLATGHETGEIYP